MYIFILLLLTILGACGPLSAVTRLPGYALMGHDLATKRDRLIEYAEKGDVYSQYELGLSYCCSDINSTDYKQAFKWLCSAAKQGYAKAQFTLGELYENTDNNKDLAKYQDYSKAYLWYGVSDKYMNYKASLKRKELKSKLSKQQLQNSEKLLKTWRKAKCE